MVLFCSRSTTFSSPPAHDRQSTHLRGDGGDVCEELGYSSASVFVNLVWMIGPSLCFSLNTWSQAHLSNLHATVMFGSTLTWSWRRPWCWSVWQSRPSVSSPPPAPLPPRLHLPELYSRGQPQNKRQHADLKTPQLSNYCTHTLQCSSIKRCRGACNGR